MKKIILTLMIIVSITLVSFTAITDNQKICYKKIKSVFGLSKTETDNIIDKRMETLNSIATLQKEYASMMMCFSSKEEYDKMNDSEKKLKVLKQMISHVSDNITSADDVIDELEIYCDQLMKDSEIALFASVQNDAIGLSRDEVLIDEVDESFDVQVSLTEDMMDYYYIKYFMDKYADNEIVLENFDWQSPLGEAVSRFYRAYYSVVVLKVGEKND